MQSIAFALRWGSGSHISWDLMLHNPDAIMLGTNVRIGKGVKLVSYAGGAIDIGNNCTIYDSAQIESIRDPVNMGSDCSLNPFAIIRSCGKVSIGNGVRIGPAAQILAMNHSWSDPDRPIHAQPVVGDGITVGNNVWIGSAALVLDGVSIGSNVVIGAGAVVTKSIPSCSIAIGNPARVIKHLHSNL